MDVNEKISRKMLVQDVFLTGDEVLIG